MENTSANNYANKINFMSSSAIIMFIFSAFVYHSVIVVLFVLAVFIGIWNGEKRKMLKRQQNNYYKFEFIYASSTVQRGRPSQHTFSMEYSKRSWIIAKIKLKSNCK